MRTGSVIWVISFALLLGGLGLPVPENPALVGGGYAIYRGVVATVPGLCLWYLAIICGDIVLFAISRWFFGRPSPSGWLKRWAGKKRFERYQQAFLTWGGWTLFVARFTFGIRAVAYFAAGAASYPWIRFLVVDSVSDVLDVTGSELRSAPDLGRHINIQYIIGMVTQDERMTVLLDADRLFNPDELGLPDVIS